MPKQEDAKLVHKSVAGDERAFVKLIRRYEQPLTTLIRYQIDDEDHAEDVWQDTLLAVWNNLSQLRDASNVRSWLMQVARNRCRAFYRSKQRRDVPMETYTLDRIISRYGNERMRRLEVAREVTNTIEMAPPSQRGILKLFYIEGLTIAEIAARQQLPSGTIKRRLHTARQHLRKSMDIPLDTRRTEMAAPGQTTSTHPFPELGPEITITSLAEESFSVDCRELRWWHIVPEVGDHTIFATYDAPDWSLTRTVELRVTGPAKVHDAKGVKIEVREWEPDPAFSSGQTLAMYGRLTGDEAQWLAVIDRYEDRESVFTFLDEDWKSQWGLQAKRLISDKGLFVEQAPGVFETATRATLESGAGLFTVEIAGNRFTCLRVFDLDLFDNFGEGEKRGILIEAYLTREGRTLLYRRYNARLYQGDERETPWDEEFPDNARIVIDGITYVHWYDEINAKTLAATTPSVSESQA